jgi:hypothetical protein
MSAGRNVGTKRGRLSDDELAAVEEMAGRKRTAGQIAVKLDRHPATIGWVMHRLGLKAPAVRSFNYVRNGVPVRSFSPDEDAFIQALRCQDYSWSVIARLSEKRFDHRRSAATIGTRLRMLANREQVAA